VSNPRMEENLSGWTLYNADGSIWAQSASYTDFNYPFMESWVAWGSSLADKSATQDVELRAGTYRLQASVNAVQQNNSSLTVSGVTLGLDGNTVACATADGSPEIYSVGADLDEGTYQLGLYVNSTDANWVAWDNVVLYYCGLSSITLDETEISPVKTYSAAVPSVVYPRSFSNGWNSICLPFETTVSELGAAKAVEYVGSTLVGGNSYIANFSEVTTLEANTPYMVYYDNAPKTVTFTDKTITPASTATVYDDAYDFVGTYVYFDNVNNVSPVVSGDYVINSSGLKAASGGNKLRAFRAYFRNNINGSEVNGITINGRDITGVEAVQMSDALNGDVYDLQGRKVKDAGNSQKGVYIINGNKRLIKYDNIKR